MNFIKCLAKLMAEYRKYWESENHKAALERKMQQDSIERTIMLEQYNDCANIMKEAINNCADYLGIQPVKDISAICTVNPVSRTTEGLLYFNMRARRRAGSVAFADMVRRTLQQEIDTVCACYNYQALEVSVKYGVDNNIDIRLAYASDLAAYRVRRIQI